MTVKTVAAIQTILTPAPSDNNSIENRAGAVPWYGGVPSCPFTQRKILFFVFSKIYLKQQQVAFFDRDVLFSLSV
jgi:hypothetical protein